MWWLALETLRLGTHKGHPYGIGRGFEGRSGLSTNGGAGGSGSEEAG